MGIPFYVPVQQLGIIQPMGMLSMPPQGVLATTSENLYKSGALIDEDDEIEQEGEEQQSGGTQTKKRDEVPMDVDSRYNLDKVLSDAILKSQYFKELYDKRTYHEVLEEIKKEVDNLEPTVRGFMNTPSSAFTLLYKLFTMHLTNRQLNGMLNPKSSPFIRGLALLYVRLVVPRNKLWDYISPYLDDEDEVTLNKWAKEEFKIKIGLFARRLLEDRKHFEIFLPNIPPKIRESIRDKLAEKDGFQIEKIEKKQIDTEELKKREREFRNLERLETKGSLGLKIPNAGTNTDVIEEKENHTTNHHHHHHHDHSSSNSSSSSQSDTQSSSRHKHRNRSKYKHQHKYSNNSNDSESQKRHHKHRHRKHKTNYSEIKEFIKEADEVEIKKIEIIGIRKRNPKVKVFIKVQNTITVQVKIKVKVTEKEFVLRVHRKKAEVEATEKLKKQHEMKDLFEERTRREMQAKRLREMEWQRERERKLGSKEIILDVRGRRHERVEDRAAKKKRMQEEEKQREKEFTSQDQDTKGKSEGKKVKTKEEKQEEEKLARLREAYGDISSIKQSK
ncbi:MAG: putative Pre-mRNA-splicing factor 38B [Streblomastix strix]|uniref:Pre-mRNA-splicing factor 38 n=1 Tax=Streblomastix strix TaxID=222440 RepID=A0A5J4UVT8_9EUKA|nr:MAG: putative Pre-mRNA-splicing factor 38B [Streblomastix strix]